MNHSEFDDEDDKQHLTDVQLQKLRSVAKTKLSGELTIRSSDLQRTLYLAGQNLPTNTVEIIRKRLEEIYHTDEYFLDEMEFILAPFWEDLSEDDIARLLIESFEIFDAERQGFLLKNELIEYLTNYGEMPLNRKDFQIMFAMIKHPKQFNYQQFVQKLCYSIPKPKKKKVKRKKK